jgi:hypothetical protein
MGFNSVVLTIAIAILVICLVLIGWGIYESVYGSEAKWPPISSTCPDYWVSSSTFVDGNKNKRVNHCTNNLKLGLGSAGSGNPKCDKFIQDNVKTNCEKLAFSRVCGVNWDGITDNTTLSTKCQKSNH